MFDVACSRFSVRTFSSANVLEINHLRIIIIIIIIILRMEEKSQKTSYFLFLFHFNDYSIVAQPPTNEVELAGE